MNVGGQTLVFVKIHAHTHGDAHDHLFKEKRHLAAFLSGVTTKQNTFGNKQAQLAVTVDAVERFWFVRLRLQSMFSDLGLGQYKGHWPSRLVLLAGTTDATAGLGLSL